LCFRNFAKGLVIVFHIVYNKTSKEGSPLNANDTIQFSVRGNQEDEMRNILRVVHQALEEKGYNPISQMVGYILSEDPTYITTHNNARSLIRRIDRDELLQALVKEYLKKDEA